MNKVLIAFALASMLAGCLLPTKNRSGKRVQKNQATSLDSSSDTVPKVTGIGGIFFFSDHPKETKEWYHTNLGLETNAYGSSFESRNVNKPEEINRLQWSPFKNGSNYFAPSKKDFMINYRVQNIRGLVKKLKGNGVTILDTVESYSYGKFVHILDTEGNKIELWEPVDQVSTTVEGKATK